MLLLQSIQNRIALNIHYVAKEAS